MRLPYQTITQQNPFLYFTVENLNLASLATNVGPTQLAVWRVRKSGGAQVNYPGGQLYPVVYYNPLEVSKKQRFTFVMDTQLFQQPEGRFAGLLQYNGTNIGIIQFIYSNPCALLVPDQECNV